ncbi:hypothetical protein HPT25_19545 [Bacillus sp. BRMEA1]|uniref:hypothetical protein n=1 Tax=Neobacillus endophyticus TaxID=2738405 RepID=UPI0015639534|nr:hypothetical protein [Neobacillus endophyticus]NRD79558.1 hypothetical protein [Neobacillus endophyticus]
MANNNFSWSDAVWNQGSSGDSGCQPAMGPSTPPSVSPSGANMTNSNYNVCNCGDPNSDRDRGSRRRRSGGRRSGR